MTRANQKSAIGDCWKRFQTSIPSNTDDDQIRAMQQAFLAGASAIYLMLGPVEPSLTRIAQVGCELVLFAQSVEEQEATPPVLNESC